MIVWIASYPKSGNTWVRTLINQIIQSDSLEKDNVFKNLKSIPNYPLKSHYKNILDNINLDKLTGKDLKNITLKNWLSTQRIINSSGKVNFLKTHTMLCKINIEKKDFFFTDKLNTYGVIYIVRDPRNVISSFKNFLSYDDIEETFEVLTNANMWIDSDNIRMPQFISSWGNNYNSWKNFPNFLLIKYEDLIINPERELNKIINYLNKFIKISLENIKINKIIENSSFNNLKKLENEGKFYESSTNPKTGQKNTFFNLGPKNNWQELLDKNISDKIERVYFKEMKELGYL